MSLPNNPPDDEIVALLRRTKRIAVIGLSPKAHRDSHRVSAYMQRAGYRIIPVYPRDETILGEKVYRTVAEIEEPVDLVNVFRRSEELQGVADDILRMAQPNKAAVWFQLDCIDEIAFERLIQAGHTLISDECLMVEHSRLKRLL